MVSGTVSAINVTTMNKTSGPCEAPGSGRPAGFIFGDIVKLDTLPTTNDIEDAFTIT